MTVADWNGGRRAVLDRHRLRTITVEDGFPAHLVDELLSVVELCNGQLPSNETWEAINKKVQALRERSEIR